jgi:N-acyl-D-amino-acid deacylase
VGDGGQPPSASSAAALVIEATGLALAPGFIDIHNHSDLTLLADPQAESMLGQGVTTTVVGNCGSSAAPWLGPEGGPAAERMRDEASRGLGVEWAWRGFGEYLQRLQGARPAINVAALAGHGTIRQQVMGLATRAPDAGELRRMKAMLEAALAEGAAGLSSGLVYYPSCYAATEELVELARLAGAAGKLYCTHIRSEAEALLEAVAEAIDICRRAGVSTEISHLKAESRLMWGRLAEALGLIEAARAEGLPVDGDQYPYTAYNSGLDSFLPPEVMEGDWRAVLRSAEGRARMRRAMDEGHPPTWTSSIRGMDWGDFFVDETGDPGKDGQSLAAIAEADGKDPYDAFFDLLLAGGPRVEVIGHAMIEDDVRLGLARPDIMVGSDGSALPYDGKIGRGHPHPRNFGTFPRVLGRYARDLKLLPLEAAVRKMTFLPATKLGFDDRGLIREGYAADLVLFDPARIRDTATFEKPHARPEGISWVFVNGRPALTPDGWGERAGMVLV